MGNKSEMTEEEKKKRKILNLAHTINVYEKEFLPEFRAILDASQSKIDFLNGIILGLVLGIFGNLIAQYFYLVLEGIMLLRFDNLFYVNGFVFSISIIIVVFVVYYFKKRITGEKQYLWSMKDGVTNLERRTEDLRVKLEALKLDWEPQEKNHE